MSAIVECPKCKCQIEVKVAFASGPKSSAPEPSSSGDLAALLDRIVDDELSGAAAKFVRETRERFEQYGSRTRMSDKQLVWLQRIAGGETGNEW